LLLSSSPAALIGGSDRYIPLGYTAAAQNSYFKSMVFPFAATIKSVKFAETVQPASGATWVATVYVNGSPTTASATVSSALAIADWTGSISVNAGDHAAILIHSTGAPASSLPMVSVGITPANANDTLIPGGATGGTFSTSSTQVVDAFTGISPIGITNTRRTQILPEAGTIDKFYIVSVAPGAAASGKSYAYTTLVNGSSSGITATISETATGNSDTTHSASPSAGDFINFQGVPTGTPTASDAGFGLRYLPSSAGRYAMIGGDGGSPSTSATQYMNVSGTRPFTATESTAQSVTHKQTIEKIRVKSVVAPGSAASGKRWDVCFRVNGVDSSLCCSITETATTCSNTGLVAVQDNDLINYSVTPTNTPAATQLGVGFLATR
jgi:hypothetical protein